MSNEYIEECAKAAWQAFGGDDDAMWDKHADREAWTAVARAVLEAGRPSECLEAVEAALLGTAAGLEVPEILRAAEDVLLKEKP